MLQKIAKREDLHLPYPLDLAPQVDSIYLRDHSLFQGAVEPGCELSLPAGGALHLDRYGRMPPRPDEINLYACGRAPVGEFAAGRQKPGRNVAVNY